MIKFKNLLIGTLIIGGIISFFGTNVKAEEDYNKINSRIDYIPNEETTFNISTNSNFNMNKVMKNNFVQGGTLWKEVDKIERYGKTYNSTVFDFVSGYDNNKKYGNKGKYVESKEKYGIYRDYKTNEQQRKLLVDELVNMLSTDRLYGQNGRYSATRWALSKYDDKSYIEDIDMRIADLKNTKTQLEAIEFELKTLYQNAADTMVGGFHITNTYNKQDYIQMNAGYYMGVFADQKNNYDVKNYYNAKLKKEVEKASKYNLSAYLDKGESREDIQMVDLESMLNECPSQKQLFYYNMNKLLDFISKNAKSGKISTKSGATTYIYTREDSPLKVSNLSSIFEGTYKLPFNTTKEIDWHNAIGDAYGSMIAKVTFNSNNTFNIDFNYYLQDQYIWGSNYNRAGSNARAASEGGLSILCKVGYSAKKGVLQEIEGKDTVDYVEETVTPKEYKMLGIYNDSYKNLSLNYRFPAKDPQEKNRIYYYDDNAKLLKTLMLNKSEELTLETSLTSKEGYKLVGWVDRVEGSELYPIESEEAIYPEKDMILTPKYERLNVVTFKDYDGTILNTQYVERGKSAVAPKDPVSNREGYYFTSWDKEFDSIYRDTTITAKYALKKYKVKYYDKDGKIIGHPIIYKHGSDGTGDVKAPEYPGYTFKGWDKDITNITSDMNVKAIYEKNKYSVEFRGYKNGIKDSLIDKQTVEYGNSAIAPTVPNDPAYTFLKWDRDYSIITANTVVNGVYSINEYKVSFVDYDDKLLSMQTVKYGDSAIAPKSPVREGYIFKGWDKSFNRVTSSIKVEPVYEKIKNKVVFKDNITGKVIFTQYVSYNENAKVPTIPEVEGYTFVNWQGDYSNVKEPKEIIANYKKRNILLYLMILMEI
ncbi:MAG: InlB B-repeat-containing protein [Clostridiales bacterium]|nr:InlB B-repeat-containing protein [Clostridiales bacterium]